LRRISPNNGKLIFFYIFLLILNQNGAAEIVQVFGWVSVGEKIMRGRGWTISAAPFWFKISKNI
jgi:hypothetical protein